MATELAAQLKSLAASAGTSSGSAGTKSFLYDSKKAGDIGVKEIYEQAVEGLESLVKTDPRLKTYKNSLFSAASLEFDREQQNMVENDRMDNLVRRFCYKLLPHFQSKAAAVVLEYLIRKYKIHRTNAADYLSAFLPYHGTPEFARMVQISHIEYTEFKAFAGTKKTGAVITRQALVNRCIKDHALLKKICESVMFENSNGTMCEITASFYATLLCEIILASQPASEQLIALILPYLLPGLAPSASSPLRCGTLTICSCILSCSGISSEVALALTADACTNISRSSLQGTLMFAVLAWSSFPCIRSGWLEHVSGHSASRQILPLSAALALLKAKHLALVASKLRNRNVRVDGFIVSVCLSVIALAQLETYNVEVLNAAKELLRDIRVCADHAMVVCAHALRMFVRAPSSQAQMAVDLVGMVLRDAECSKVLQEALTKVILSSAQRELLQKAIKGARTDEEFTGMDFEAVGGDDGDIGMSIASLNDILLQGSGPRFESVLAKLSEMHRQGTLDSSITESIQGLLCKPLVSSDHAAMLHVLKSPLFGLLRPEEKVPWMLKSLRGLSMEVWKIVPVDVKVAGVVRFAALWKWPIVRKCAKALLEGVCAAAAGFVEWEKEIVVWVLPWLSLYHKWGNGVVIQIVRCLEKLKLWRQIAGVVGSAAGVGSTDEGGDKPEKQNASKGDSALTQVSVIQKVQAGMASCLTSSPSAWKQLYELESECSYMNVGDSRLVVLYILTLGVVRAWYKADKLVEKSPVMSEQCLMCAKWLFSMLQCTSAFKFDAEEHGMMYDDESYDSEGLVSKVQLKLQEQSVSLAVCKLVCKACSDIVSSMAPSPTASLLFDQVLQPSLSDFAKCLLSFDPPPGLSTSPSIILLWKIMNIADNAVRLKAGAASVTSWMSADILSGIVALPEASAEGDCAKEQLDTMQTRALALLPLAYSGKFAEIDASDETIAVLKRAMMWPLKDLHDHTQRLNVFMMALFALRSPSKSLRVHASRLLDMMSTVPTGNAVNSSSLALWKTAEVLSAKRSELVASQHAVFHLLADAKLKELPVLLVHVICPVPTDCQGLSACSRPTEAESTEACEDVPEALLHSCAKSLSLQSAEKLRMVMKLIAQEYGSASLAITHAFSIYILRNCSQLLADNSVHDLLGLVMDMLQLLQGSPLPPTPVSDLPGPMQEKLAALRISKHWRFSIHHLLKACIGHRVLCSGTKATAGQAHNLLESVRQYTLSEVVPSVWSVLLEEEKCSIVPLMASCAASDQSVACRSAAQSALQQLSRSVPVPCITSPLQALSTSFDAFQATDRASQQPSHIINLFESVLEGSSPTKRQKPASELPDQDTDEPTELPVEQLNTSPEKQYLKAVERLCCNAGNAQRNQHQAPSMESMREHDARELLSLMGWVGPQGYQPLKHFSDQLAVVHSIIAQESSRSEATGDGNIYATMIASTKAVVWNHLLDRAAHTLNFIQHWKETVLDEESSAQVLVCLKALVTSCSCILSNTDGAGGEVGGASKGFDSDKAQLDSQVAHVISLAVAAIQKISTFVPPSLPGAAIPLQELMPDILRLQSVAYIGMQDVIKVLVVSLRGASCEAIGAVLPDIISLAVSSTLHFQATPSDSDDVPAYAMAAAASQWVATGGKPRKFLATLVQHLGSAAAIRQAKLATVAIKSAYGSDKSAAGLQCLAHLLLDLESEESKAMDTGEAPVADPSDTLAATFKMFPCHRRLQAVDMLLQDTVKKGKVAGNALQVLKFSLHQVKEAGRSSPVEGHGMMLAPQAVLKSAVAVSSVLAQASRATSEAPKSSKGKASRRNQATKHVSSCITAVFSIVAALQKLLQPEDFLGTLKSICGGDSDDMHCRLALRTFSKYMSSSLSKLEHHPCISAAAAEFACNAAAIAASASTDSITPDTRRSAAAAVQALASSCKAKEEMPPPDSILPALPLLATAAGDACLAVRVAALSAAQDLVFVTGNLAIAHAPVLAEAALQIVQGQRGEPQSEESAAAMSLIDTLVHIVPGMLFPYLHEILRLALLPTAAHSRDSTYMSIAKKLCTSMTTCIEFRVLSPALQKHLEETNEVNSTTALSMCSALDMVADSVHLLDTSVAASHTDVVVSAVLVALDARGRSSTAFTHARKVEQSAYKAMVALVLKLSEKQFKPLFMDLKSWAGTVPAFVASSKSSSIRRRAAAARKCAWLGLVSELARTLRAVFTPYYEGLLESLVESLDEQVVEKSKRSKRSRDSLEDTAVNAAPRVEDEVKQRAVACIHRCCMHDNVGFINDDRYLALITPLLSHLSRVSEHGASPGSQSADMNHDDENRDLLLSIQLGDRSMGQVSDATAGCIAAIVAVAATTHDDLTMKKTNHQVLMLTRSENSGLRLAALETVYNLAAHFREDYLGLLPETLPFVSELLEDANVAVLNRCQDLIKLLEGYTAENLDSYLKS